MIFTVQSTGIQNFIFVLNKRIKKDWIDIIIEETDSNFRSVVSTLRRLLKSGLIRVKGDIPLLTSPFISTPPTSDRLPDRLPDGLPPGGILNPSDITIGGSDVPELDEEE